MLNRMPIRSLMPCTETINLKVSGSVNVQSGSIAACQIQQQVQQDYCNAAMRSRQRLGRYLTCQDQPCVSTKQTSMVITILWPDSVLRTLTAGQVSLLVNTKSDHACVVNKQV